MPRRPLKPCPEPGCPRLVESGRCPQHQRAYATTYNRTMRPQRHQFYHTPAWRALSKQVLQEQPQCPCGARATQADHIKSVKDYPDLALERTNLVGRCRPCHSRKTAEKDGRWTSRA